MTASKLPKLVILAMCLGLATNSCFPLSVESKQTKGGAKAAKSKKSDKGTGDTATEIRSQLDVLEKTLAEGNAKQLSSLWTEDATYTDESGSIVKGRPALEEWFTNKFTDDGKPQMEFVSDSTKLLSNNVALSEGVVRRKVGSTKTPETRYSLVFQKQGGTWLISSAVESPLLTDEMATDPLKDLSWMVGEWAASSKGGSVHMKADWAADQNFITCHYVIQKSPDAKKVESKQIIGWDPRTEKPISWNFDASGGFGYGNWTLKDGKWVIESSGIDRDGSATVATNIITHSTPDSFDWQSINRSVDGVQFTDTAPLKVERVK